MKDREGYMKDGEPPEITWLWLLFGLIMLAVMVPIYAAIRWVKRLVGR